MFIFYFILSGLILWLWVSYREYETRNQISVLNILLNLVGCMLIGWVMLPIIAIASLDNIKIK